MDRVALMLGLAFLALGAYALSGDALVVLGIGFLVIGALYVVAAFSSRVNAFVLAPLLRRK